MGVIFIIDDEEDILFVLKFWLEKDGYEVHVFTNSKDMFQLLDGCMPDIMLLDINLAGEDGREICNKMRKERNYNKPILYISANHYVLEKALGSCANGCIPKPFNLKELTKTVDSFISS